MLVDFLQVMSEYGCGLNFDKVFRNLLQTSISLASHFWHRESQSEDVEKLALDFDKLVIDFNEEEKNAMNLIAGMIEFFFQNNPDYMKNLKSFYERHMHFPGDVQHFLLFIFEIQVIEIFIEFYPPPQSDVYLALKCVINCLVFSSIFVTTLRDRIGEENVLFDKVRTIVYQKCDYYKVPELLQRYDDGFGLSGKIEMKSRRNHLLNITISRFEPPIQPPIEPLMSFDFEKVVRLLLEAVARLALHYQYSSELDETIDFDDFPVDWNVREMMVFCSIKHIVERFFKENPIYMWYHERLYPNDLDLRRDFLIFDMKVWGYYKQLLEKVSLVDGLTLDVHSYQTLFINLLILSGIFLMILRKRKIDQFFKEDLGDKIFGDGRLSCISKKFIQNLSLTWDPFDGIAIKLDLRKGLNLELVKDER